MILPGSDDWELHRDRAHPRARVSLEEAFFWDAIDDSAPWGSDEGSDALAAFGGAHQDGSPPSDPAQFALDYAGTNWHEVAIVGEADEGALEEYSVGNIAMIAVALGMYMLHGYVTDDLKALGLEAIDRELQPHCLTQFGFPEERAQKLRVCRERLESADTIAP